MRPRPSTSETQPRQDASWKKGGESPTSSSGISVPAFLERVSRTLAGHNMIGRAETVLVALSGGPDSTALLHAMWRLRERLKCRITACHVHHGLRGEEADADAKQAAALARSLKVPFTLQRANVQAFAQSHKLSLEAAAREVRYALLERAAERRRGSRIATGHTADDQAETVLLNLLRGAGAAGLAGIPPVRGRIIRPLLDLTRAEVEQYCQAEELTFRMDRSNLDRRFTRNRIRHEVMPVLREMQPNVAGALCRLAEIVREENAYMSEQAAQALRETGAERPGEVRIASQPFSLLARALQRRVVRRAIARVKGDEQDLELERIDALVALAVSGRTGAIIELPEGVRGDRTYGGLLITAAAPKPAAPAQDWTLPVPGRASIQELGVEITAALSRARRPPADPNQALLDMKAINPPLTVRTWRRGDRFRPLGMRKAMKVHDFFVNSKIPRAERAQIPLLLSDDEIVWVVGHRIDDRHKVTSRTRRTMRVEVHPLD